MTVRVHCYLNPGIGLLLSYILKTSSCLSFTFWVTDWVQYAELVVPCVVAVSVFYMFIAVVSA